MLYPLLDELSEVEVVSSGLHIARARRHFHYNCDAYGKLLTLNPQYLPKQEIRD